MARVGTARRRDARGQLTFSELIEKLPRLAEERDASRPATQLFCVALALMGIGLLVQVSHAATVSSPEVFLATLREQAIFRVAGVLAMIAAFRVGARGVRPFLPAMLVVSALLLIMVFVPPFAAPKNGSNRWIDLGLVSFQPSELARIVLVLWVADRCARLGPVVRDLRSGVLPMLAVVLVLFGLVLVETDLGGAMLLLICSLSAMWVGGAHFSSMAMTLVGIGGGVITAASALIPYMRNRLHMWLGQTQNAQVDGTLAAIASGGLWGVGVGRGAARNSGVPYLESDYVFAQIGEELGLVGMCIVLGLILSFLWFSLRLVLSIRDPFAALAAFGLLISVGLQAMLHVQVVAGLAPPKGMTLPFISDGGTSLIVSSLAVGLALGATRRPCPEPTACNPSSVSESSPSSS